jgi:hypothetical protein
MIHKHRRKQSLFKHHHYHTRNNSYIRKNTLSHQILTPFHTTGYKAIYMRLTRPCVFSAHNSVTPACEQTVLTERLPLVGEISAKFSGERGVAWSAARRIPMACNLSFLDQLFIPHLKKNSVASVRKQTIPNEQPRS